MILVFDLGGPLLAYSLLRTAGMSAVAALVISGVLPALGIGISALTDRRLDVVGMVVLAGLLVGTLLGLTSHNARLYLLEGSVPSAVFALGCLLSLRLRRPLIFRLAVELLGLDTRKGRDVTAAVDGDRPGLLQADPLRVRRGLVRLDTRLLRAREEEGRTPGRRHRHRQRRRQNVTASPYKLVRCLAR